MKYKIIALMLALTVMTWAQTATPTAPSTSQSAVPADKAKCQCCDKMAAADAKDAHASCMRHDMKAGDSKEKKSCCEGKEASSSNDKDAAMSCMKGDKEKAAASSCGDKCGKDKTAAACCDGKDCGKDCCSKKAEKTAASCCESKLHS
jgi:hypothetical protein